MQRNTISILLQILCFAFLSSTLGFSQTNDSETIYLRVSATDKYGRIVTDLKKESFKVKEGKIEQEISYFSDLEEPAMVVILIDISASVELKTRQAAAKAALKFVQLANNKNDYLLVAFGNEVYPLTDWGSTDEQIVEALNKVASLKFDSENTGLYDACSFALEKLEKGKYQKKILLIFSDGMDTVSDKSFRKVREKIKTSDVLIFSISLVDRKDLGSMEAIQGQAFLDELTGITGGKGFYPQTQKELDEIMERISMLLQKQYVIGYKPKENPKKDRWRSVEVKAEGLAENGKKVSLKVFTRKGYYTERAQK